MADELGTGGSRFYFTGPAGEKGHAVAAVPDVGLVAAELRAGEVALFFEGGCVGLRRAAVVGGEDDERVGGEAVFVEGGENVSDDGVGLHDEITVGAEAAFALPLGRRENRRVRRRERDVEEKRLPGFRGGGVFGDVADGLTLEAWEHLDGRETFDDAVVFDEAGHRAGVGAAPEVIEAARDGTADDTGADREAGVAHLRFFRGCGGCRCSWRGRTLGEKSEVPLADGGSGVAIFLQQGWHGETILGDEWRIVGAVEHALLEPAAPRVTTGEQAVARGRADGGAAVGVGERHALRGEAVEVGRLNFPARRVERLHVAVAEIVGEDVDDIGSGALGSRHHSRC